MAQTNLKTNGQLSNYMNTRLIALLIQIVEKKIKTPRKRGVFIIVIYRYYYLFGLLLISKINSPPFIMLL